MERTFIRIKIPVTTRITDIPSPSRGRNFLFEIPEHWRVENLQPLHAVFNSWYRHSILLLSYI